MVMCISLFVPVFVYIEGPRFFRRTIDNAFPWAVTVACSTLFNTFKFIETGFESAISITLDEALAKRPIFIISRPLGVSRDNYITTRPCKLVNLLNDVLITAREHGVGESTPF